MLSIFLHWKEGRQFGHRQNLPDNLLFEETDSEEGSLRHPVIGAGQTCNFLQTLHVVDNGIQVVPLSRPQIEIEGVKVWTNSLLTFARDRFSFP